MSLFGTTIRYGSLAQAFHWLTALLVLAAFLVSEGGPPTRVYSEANAATLQLHESLGFAVFVLLVIRLLWRVFDRVPEAPPMPGWMDLASKVTHWALYALLFAVPLTAMASEHLVRISRRGIPAPPWRKSTVRLGIS